MIGLFLGGTDFPSLILKNIKKYNKKYFIIDLTKKNNFKKDKNSYFISIGKFGEILKIIKNKNCKKVLFAGKIEKPKISNLKLDYKGLYYLPRIVKSFKLGDAAILKELIKILDENNIKVIKSNFYNPELTLKKGCYTKSKPNKKEFEEIKFGKKYLNKINPYNHTQAIIVKNKKIINKENHKGTKQMIRRLKNNKYQNSILIKFPKKEQDNRADLPTIGYDTFVDCFKANIKGIVLKSNANIFLDKKKSIKFANKHNIFLYVI